jgi:hypothetical protein
MLARRRRHHHVFALTSVTALIGIVAAPGCKSDDEGPVDRVWYTASASTAPTPCLAKEDGRVVGFLEKTWGKSGSRCIKRIDYGPETIDKDGRGDPIKDVNCLYGVIWTDC